MTDVSKMRAEALALVLIALLLIPLPLAVQGRSNTVPDHGPVVVLTTPWQDPLPAIIAAGGHQIGPARAAFGVLAASDYPTFATRLADNGLWAVQSHILSRLICRVPS